MADTLLTLDPLKVIDFGRCLRLESPGVGAVCDLTDHEVRQIVEVLSSWLESSDEAAALVDCQHEWHVFDTEEACVLCGRSRNLKAREAAEEEKEKRRDHQR